MGSICCASRKSTISLPVRTNASGAGFDVGSASVFSLKSLESGRLPPAASEGEERGSGDGT